MILVKPGFTIETQINHSILRNIERFGRTCYKSEKKTSTFEECAAFVERLIKNGHESVLEHEKITVKIICDRGVSHELVRHRIASYSMESTRYCNYEKQGHVTFVIPSWLNMREGEYKTIEDISYERVGILWRYAMLRSERSYLGLLKQGWTPQQARSVLPNSLKTEIVVTMNLRQWRYFFKVRALGVSGKPHPQMLEITIPMLKEFQKLLPEVFGDLIV